VAARHHLVLVPDAHPPTGATWTPGLVTEIIDTLADTLAYAA